MHGPKFLNNLIVIECLLSQIYRLLFRMHRGLKDGQFHNIVSVYETSKLQSSESHILSKLQ